MKTITAEPHHAGSAGSRKVAEYILGKVQVVGPQRVDRAVRSADALPDRARRRTRRTRQSTSRALKEPVVADDPDSGDAGQLPTFNAYSADGDVTANLVYVNYGTPGGLRTARETWRRRQRQHRHRQVRPQLARHQTEGRGRARCRRLHHLLGSARRRVLSGGRLRARCLAPGAGRAARQRHGHAGLSRRSAVAGMGLGTGQPQARSQRGRDAC